MARGGVPTAEHGLHGRLKLGPGVFGNVPAGVASNGFFVIPDDSPQLLRAQLLILGNLCPSFGVAKDSPEHIVGHVQNHAGVDLEKSTIGIVGRPGIIHQPGQTLGDLVVNSQVQYGIHHSPHGYRGDGADRDQQRVGRRAEFPG